MKSIQHHCRWLLVLLALGLLLMAKSARSEDIDIYFENSSEGVLPKVLFMVDNSSNVGSQWGPGCTGYADGSGAPSMGTTTAGGIIQCALVDAINSLPNDTLQVGLMSGNANNFGRSRGCVGSSGGCLLYPLTTINASTRPALIAFIKGWKNSNSGETETSFPFTVTNAESGGMMQEAYAYFYASTGLSGRSYAINHIAACQKNFIIYIGNTDKTPANDEPSGASLRSVATGTLTDKITTTQKFEPKPGICGDIESKVAGTNANDWSSNWADEWARFLLKKDGGTSTQEGAQNIRTYTIGLIQNDSNQCTADYPALLQSMAVEGGGEAYRVGDAGAVKKALAEALNEVQAVNSVFSSASLPVSVNAEGSYLNQIFLGMFRPDSTGAPRWLGNLKQYQLIRNSAGNLVMGDACDGDGCPKAAINPSTGFLSPNSISFWTYKNAAVLPDSVGGFFVNDQDGVSGGFDREDGEMVQKGGVAQQLRKQNLTATFAGAGGTTVNPRRVYTYCPDRDLANCTNKDLTHADNDFSTSNARISANSFGAAVSLSVRSIQREGPVATVTTASNHGLTAGSVVTIRNATQPEYNRTGPITLVAGALNQFRMTVPDYPTAPSQGGYTISVPGTVGNKSIVSLTRATSATQANTERVTVVTADAHLFLEGQTVTITGNSAAEYNRSWTIETVPGFNQFTFLVPISPGTPGQNTYQVVHPPTSIAFSAITLAGGVYTVETASAPGFHVGQTVTISGVKGSDRDLYNKDHVVTGLGADGRSFTIQTPAGLPGNSNSGGNVSPSQTPQTVTIVRNTTAVAGATAVVSGLPANWFANGKRVNITSTGDVPNEGAYVKNDVTISCTGTCTSFSYPITVTPAVSGTGGSAYIPGAGSSANISAGAITRVGGTATVSGLTPNLFTDGSTVNISPRGTALSTEAAYVNSWQITCVPGTSCASFTFGPVTQTPAVVATGSNIQAFSSNTAPDKDSMIRWLRGQDNNGDEKGPGNGVTVRGSIHGDVLHSRPLVINYGDARGIVVFYGSNDGVYRAVNGNQKDSTITGGITVPAGGEFWGLVLPEHYELINRIRSNSPELKFPGTFLESARPKDYFVDGPTGVYQKIDANGVITQAIIYLTMRRGGRFLVALDVTQPAAPQFLWKIDQQTAGFEELGQTWSRPRVTLLQDYRTASGGVSTRPPVLVFGAGYDPAQDAEPPTTNTMGRGIFIVNALTGAKIFSASVSCPADTANCRRVTDMKYATPSDITFVDRDQNGFIDKLYWGDLGGNVWRADVADASVSNWSITKVAALGCNAGECSSIVTPRKFFFPPAVLSIRPAGDLNSYDLLSMASGDREHPLRSDVATAAFNTNDRFFVIKDLGTSVASTASNTSNVVPNDLFNATYTTWTGTGTGFYLNFVGGGWNETTNQADASLSVTPGEKAVNAPIAVNGQIFFATNQPRQRDNTCVANLGIARGYAVDPFSGRKVRNQLEGGGMPPTAVTGLITITETKDGQTTTSQEKFCIGCSVSGAQAGGTNTAPCNSALENCNLGTVVPKNLKRTYWYKK